MNIDELTLLNIGFILEGKANPIEYDPKYFRPPYNKVIQALKENPEALKDKDKADSIISKILLLEEIELAHQVAARQNGLGEEGVFNFRGALADAYYAWTLGDEAEKLGKKMKNNEEVDLLPYYSKLTSHLGGQKSGLRKADEIDFSHYKPFMKSGYKPIDDIIGGIPSDGPVVVYGLTGVGKSHWTFNMVCCWLAEHPDKTAAIYTLEMGEEHYLQRELAMYPEHKAVLSRLHVSGSVRNIEELVAEVSASHVGMVAIDDMDGLVSEQAASEYEKVYKRVKEICRFLKIPVIVLGQPNRTAKVANRFLNTYDIAWSGASENSAALLIALQRVDPTDGDFQDDRFPPSHDNKPRYYMIFWKSRDGWPLQIGPGAIRIEPGANGKYNQMWKGEVYKNKLWTPSGGSLGSGGNKKKLNKRDDEE
jgi:hypothetical protein